MDPTSIIYLDHAAATPLDERVLESMRPYFEVAFFNPSSPYAPAVAVRNDYEAAKARIAKILGARPAEIVMTAGATESVNLALRGKGGHVVTSEIEHESVLAAAKNADHTLMKPSSKGRIEPAAVRDAIRPETTIVSVAIANGELGTIQPLADIAQVIQEERMKRMEKGDLTPIYFHSDASQGAGLLDIHVSRLGVDMLTLNAAKLYGPKQVGLLWVGRTVTIEPQILGGGQEGGLRSGTENVAGAVGFARALEIAEKDREEEADRLSALRDYLQEELTTAFPEAIVSGDQKHRLASHLHIAFPGLDGERLVFLLENKGVLLSTGSACAANKGTASHVLRAIGMQEDAVNGSLRISLGRLSNEENIKKAALAIIEAVKSEYQRIK